MKIGYLKKALSTVLCVGITFSSFDVPVFAQDSLDSEEITVLAEEADEDLVEVPAESEGTQSFAEEIVDEGADFSFDSEESFFNSSSDYVVDVDFTGTYYTLSAQTILARLNQIRYEACEEGLIFSGRVLSLDDYHPLEWSYALEEGTRIRAMEAAMLIAHQTLSGIEIYSYARDLEPGFKRAGVGENLAWNNNHDASGITYGINQFYSEKNLYISSGGSWSPETGHYANLINPGYRYVGVASCMMSGAPYGWNSIAMQLAYDPGEEFTVDTTKDDRTGSITNTIPVSSSYISGITISGDASVPKGISKYYTVNAKVSVPNVYAPYSKTFPTGTTGKNPISWESSNEEILTVSNGEALGHKGGMTTITAAVGALSEGTETDDRIKASKTVSVTVPLEDIRLSWADSEEEVTKATINRNEETTRNLTTTFLPDDVTDNKKVAYKTSNSDVVAVDTAGKLTFKKPGTAVITATATSSNKEYGKKGVISKTVKITVTAPVTGISLNKEEVLLSYTTASAPTTQLSVVYTPSDTDSEKNVTWESSDEKVAVVDENGKVTAVGGGSAVITATSCGYSAQCTVTVDAPVKDIILSENPKKLYLSDDTTDLEISLKPLYTSDKEVTFTSSNTEVVRIAEGENGGKSLTVSAVDGKARVTLERIAGENGQASLEISVGNGKKIKNLNVIVARQSESIAINVDGRNVIQGEAINLGVGSSLEATALVLPENAYDRSVIWSSSDPDIVSVDRSGAVVALREGTVVITATNNNASEALSASFVVISSLVVGRITLNHSEYELYEGDSYRLRARVVPEGMTGSLGESIPAPVGAGDVYAGSMYVSYSSSDQAVATVDNNGIVTAISAGTAVITARIPISEGASVYKEASCAFTVKKADYDLLEVSDEPYGTDNRSGIWVAKQSFEDQIQYTGGKIVQSDLRVYYNKTLLKEKTDYTVTYKNNQKASGEGTDRAKMTVKMKGQYSGERDYYFTITPVNIGEGSTDIVIPGVTTASYNKKFQNIVPDMFYRGVKLKKDKDFTVSGSSFDEKGKHLIIVTGIGNYSGSRDIYVAIADPEKNLSKAAVSVNGKLFYDGTTIDFGEKVVVTVAKKTINRDYYTVSADSQKAGAINVTIAASEAGMLEGYYGYKTVKLTAYADRSLKDVTTTGVENQVYNRKNALSKDGITLPMLTLKYLNGDVLEYGRDYTVKYFANKKVGKATVVITGAGRYEGSVKQSFAITADNTLSLSYADTTYFTKGGVKPSITVKDRDGSALLEKTDYSVVIINKSNMSPGIMQCQVVGKGNYKGYSSDIISIKVLKGKLSRLSLTVDDKPFSTKQGAWKSSIKLVDTNGKALQAGKDYNKNVIYTYQGMEDNVIPQAGTIVYVTVVGINDYAGSAIAGSYRIFTTNVSKLYVVIDDMTYTGAAIEPGDSNIHIYESSKDAKAGVNELNPVRQYVEIVGYTANVNTGKGKITLRGRNGFGGVRTCDFKILKRNYD